MDSQKMSTGISRAAFPHLRNRVAAEVSNGANAHEATMAALVLVAQCIALHGDPARIEVARLPELPEPRGMAEKFGREVHAIFSDACLMAVDEGLIERGAPRRMALKFIDDEALCKLIQSQDRMAERELVDRYSGFINRHSSLLYERSKSIFQRAGIEFADFVSSMNIIFTRSIPNFSRDKGAFSTYLITAIRREAVHIAKRAHRGWYGTSTDIDIVDETIGVETMLENNEAACAAQAVIDTLPPRQREIFIQRIVNEEGLSAIAEKMGISVQRVSKLARIARAKVEEGIGSKT